MRWLGLGLVFVASITSIASAKTSNPAFLGVGMQDAGGTRGIGPCMVTSVTKGTGADKAGLQNGDVFVALDGSPIANCDALVTLIQAREPGDVIKLELRRSNSLKAGDVTVQAQLLSRAELLRQKFVDQPVPSTSLVRVDNKTTLDISTQSRKTTIVGWFSPACEGCGQVFSRVVRRMRSITKGTPISILGVTAGKDHKTLDENLDELKLVARGLDVPLLVADHDTYNEFSINDGDRVHFMVIDCHGVVQYVAPVAPGADDTEAVLDELHAAAEQAARRTK